MEQRLKPSSKARERSYKALRSLFDMLDKLMISHPWFEDEELGIKPNFKGWKEWVIRHTPINKRGGPK